MVFRSGRASISGLETVAHYVTRRVHPFLKVICVPELCSSFYQSVSQISIPPRRLGEILVFREPALTLMMATIKEIIPI